MTILKEPFNDLLTPEEEHLLVDDFHTTGFIHWVNDDVEFKSGMKSHVLVGGRDDLTKHPFVLRKVGSLLAKAVEKIAKDSQSVCMIGVPMAGNTLATAAALCGDADLPFFVMRPVRKKHGAHRAWVDGNYYSYDHFVTIDNTITDGGSKFEIIDRLRQDGFYFAEHISHLVLVDRGLGATDHLRANGHDAHALFDLPVLVRAFVERGVWEQPRLDTLLEENKHYSLDV